MRTTIRIVTGLVLCLLAAACAAQSVEFRGLYVDAFHPGIKNHEEVTQMVRAAKAAHFNALLVQVRKRGDAYYNSTIEPRAADIAPDYDPLADVIRQAHALGMEVHAMVATHEVSHELYTPPDNHVCKVHPEWLMAMKDGSTVQYSKVYLDPCIPEVSEYLISVISEIVRNYPVDGIHLDGCRYVRREAMYNKLVLDAYKAQTGKTDTPAYDDPDWCNWRRDRLTSFVRDLRAKLSQISPRLKLSAAAMTPTPEEASLYCLQDWDRWMRDGLLDFVAPMVYSTNATILDKMTPLLRSRYGGHMYFAIGTWQLESAVALRQVQDARTVGANGVVLYSYYYLISDQGDAKRARITDVEQSIFADPAEVPIMPWKLRQ